MSALELIKEVEMIIHQDPGKRGLQQVWDELASTDRQNLLYTLHAASSTLFTDCKRALVCTGFVIPSVRAPETDGPPGALAICRALHVLGREVALITAPGNADLLKALLEHEKKTFGYEIQLIVAPLLKDVVDKKDWALGILKDFDHLISIEILGAATDGGYYNMRGIEASEFNSPIDVLFTLAKSDNSKIRTVSVGDGGNEIGMGNIYPFIAKHVPKGDLIGTRVECDFLISAGVSNWGGYAIASALFIQHVFQSRELGVDHDKAAIMLPNAEIESNIMDVMLANGAVDGPTCTAKRMVDSLDQEFHENIIKQMLQIVQKVECIK